MSLNAISAFAHVPKTGGLQVAWLLQRHFGARHLAVQPRQGTVYKATDLEFDLKLHRHVRSIAGHSLRPYIDFGKPGERLLWFTMLREPVSRYLSHYAHEIARGGKRDSLEMWMKKYHRGNWQVRMLAGEEDLARAIEVLEARIHCFGFVEQFDLSLALFRMALGWKNFHLGYKRRVNVADRNASASATEQAARLDSGLRSVNALDLQLYDYSLNTLWPRQLLRYGGETSTLRPSAEVRASGQPELRHAVKRLEYLAYRRVVYKPLSAGARFLRRQYSGM